MRSIQNKKKGEDFIPSSGALDRKSLDPTASPPAPCLITSSSSSNDAQEPQYELLSHSLAPMGIRVCSQGKVAANEAISALNLSLIHI